jgi:RND family efflux transporter MFP subunit
MVIINLTTKFSVIASILALTVPLTLAAQLDGGPPVRVAIARIQPLAPVTLVPATVVSRNDARLSAEVAGRLLTVADVGTLVVAGDVLASIEDQALRLRKMELQAEIQRAQAKLQFLEGELVRFSSLAESNLAAVTQLDQTRSERDVANGDLNVARARFAQNEDQLARTQIVAPFGGVVVERLMTPGERVTEGSGVVRLVDQDDLEVIARAPLDYYPFVERGQVLSLRSNTGSGFGEVRTVVAVGDENTHQFELRLDLEGRPFPVGQTLRVSIPTSDSRNVLAVPRDALVLRPEGQSVFVIDANNTARQVSVTTGVGSGDQIEVLGALSEGDQVVIRGNERLQAGQTVNILDS